MDHFSWLIYVKDRRRVEGDADLFPEHLEDPQKTLSLGGAMMGGILIGL